MPNENIELKSGQIWEIVEPIRVYAYNNKPHSNRYGLNFTRTLKSGDKVLIVNSGSYQFIDISFWGEHMWTDKLTLKENAKLIE